MFWMLHDDDLHGFAYCRKEEFGCLPSNSPYFYCVPCKNVPGMERGICRQEGMTVWIVFDFTKSFKNLIYPFDHHITSRKGRKDIFSSDHLEGANFPKLNPFLLNITFDYLFSHALWCRSSQKSCSHLMFLILIYKVSAWLTLFKRSLIRCLVLWFRHDVMMMLWSKLVSLFALDIKTSWWREVGKRWGYTLETGNIFVDCHNVAVSSLYVFRCNWICQTSLVRSKVEKGDQFFEDRRWKLNEKHEESEWRRDGKKYNWLAQVDWT